MNSNKLTMQVCVVHGTLIKVVANKDETQERITLEPLFDY